MNDTAKLGHNNPPNPIDELTAPFSDAIQEAENWLDGTLVENEGQMKAVDVLTKSMKAALKAVKDGEESAAKPLHDIWKAEKALWKPKIDDLDRIVKGLVGINADFKKRIAAEKAEAARLAEYRARKAAEEAAEKARTAALGDIQALRAAEEANNAAKAAIEAARDAKKDTVGGMRTVTKYEIDSHKDALNWIVKNDRDSVTAFIEEYVRRNHKETSIDGVRSWKDKEAF